MHVAMAHNLLRIIYAMYRDKTKYIDRPTDAYDKFKLDNLRVAAQGLKKTKFSVDTEIVVTDKNTGKVATTITATRQAPV